MCLHPLVVWQRRKWVVVEYLLREQPGELSHYLRAAIQPWALELQVIPIGAVKWVHRCPMGYPRAREAVPYHPQAGLHPEVAALAFQYPSH